MVKKIRNRKNTNTNMIFGGLILLLVLLGLFIKNIEIETTLVSYTDSTVSFSSKDKILEQTWAPHVKKIKQLKVPYRSEESFQGKLEARIVSDNNGTTMSEAKLQHQFMPAQEGELVFDFKTVRVEPGVRYGFQLIFEEDSQEGSILIPSGKEGYGGSIDNRDLGEAVDFKIISEKNSSVFWLISSFLPFFFVAFFLAVQFNRKIEETLAMAFMAIGGVLFLFGLVEKLEYGIVAVFLISILCFAGAMVLCFRKDICVTTYITPGLVFYGVAISYVMITCRELMRREWDEYSHWGLAVKDMFYYDAFAKHIDSSVPLMRYPPFTTLIEYFFTYLNEMFSEGILYVAYLSLLFSFLTIIFKNCNWKKSINFIATCIVVILLPMVFFDHYYFIYVDLMLGVVFSYVLICYFSEEMSAFNIIRICAGVSTMILIKDMGLVLAGMFLLFVFMDLAIESRFHKKMNKKDILQLGAYGACAASSFLIWQIYISIPAKGAGGIVEGAESTGKVGSAISSSQISIKGILELFQGQAPSYKYQIIKDYFYNLLEPDTWEIGKLGLSYTTIILLILLSLIYLNRKRSEKLYGRFFFSAVLISLGYTLFLLITYLFSFPRYDAVVLHSHERYLASCIGGITIACFSLVLYEERQKNTQKSKNIILVLCAILLFGVELKNINPENLVVYIPRERIAGYDEIENATRCFADRKEAVYYVYNDSRNGSLEQVIFRNYVSPLESAGGTFFVSDKMIEKEKQMIEKNKETQDKLVSKNIKTAQQWEEELRGYDYVFLHQPGYVFAESYGELFEDAKTIGDKTYYKVEEKEGDIRLRYLGKVK